MNPSLARSLTIVPMAICAGAGLGRGRLGTRARAAMDRLVPVRRRLDDRRPIGRRMHVASRNIYWLLPQTSDVSALFLRSASGVAARCGADVEAARQRLLDRLGAAGVPACGGPRAAGGKPLPCVGSRKLRRTFKPLQYNALTSLTSMTARSGEKAVCFDTNTRS
jgi:hypothetical protein